MVSLPFLKQYKSEYRLKSIIKYSSELNSYAILSKACVCRGIYISYAFSDENIESTSRDNYHTE